MANAEEFEADEALVDDEDTEEDLAIDDDLGDLHELDFDDDDDAVDDDELEKEGLVDTAVEVEDDAVDEGANLKEADPEDDKDDDENDDEDEDEADLEEADPEEDEESEEALDVLLVRDKVAGDEDLTRLDESRGDPITLRAAPIKAQEFTCRSCFLVKNRAQLADEETLICLDCA